jgi:hypothetical protein
MASIQRKLKCAKVWRGKFATACADRGRGGRGLGFAHMLAHPSDRPTAMSPAKHGLRLFRFAQSLRCMWRGGDGEIGILRRTRLWRTRSVAEGVWMESGSDGCVADWTTTPLLIHHSDPLGSCLRQSRGGESSLCLECIAEGVEGTISAGIRRVKYVLRQGGK